ncbi:MAG: hypothetical protein LBV00_01425 [Propionibacteriaceae bacterium]|nr:hypothetical protein [Propionibacteriaceae bacterium]
MNNNSHDKDLQSINDQMTWFAQQFVDGGPDFIRTHVPPHFVVGTPSGASTVEREHFIEAARKRADMVTGMDLPVPHLERTATKELGPAYCLGTAHWSLPLPSGETLNLVEDFLIDRTGDAWTCQAYLLRANLPGMLSAMAS